MQMINIDARNPLSLKQGVIDFLKLTEQELNQIFETIDSVEEDPYDWVKSFLEDYGIVSSLGYIQMFHLTRRLNGTDLRVNNNLEQLLLRETPVSDFFKRYDVIFKKSDGHMEMYYKGTLQSLDDEFYSGPGNMAYIKFRLGYFETQDYCVNGFAFRTHLEMQSYYRTLSGCPELVDNIGRFLEIESMVSDYTDNSKYYCIEYLIPLSEVIFDISNSPESELEKTHIFLSYAIERLYKEWKRASFICDDNLILRLDDSADIKRDWFINAEEIDL